MKPRLNLETEFPRLKKPSKVVQRTCKRIFDILFSLLIIFLLSPLFLAIALLILIVDGSPALFRQKRVGQEFNLFEVFKFRTMKVNNKNYEVNETSQWNDGVPDNFVFKSSDNPETTKLGKLLRKYSLDELPQFFNVLKGEMSIVGPRPEILEIARYYNYLQKERLSVKPGITGLAQISGRGELSHGEKIKHDLEYIHNWSLFLDFKILVQTIKETVNRKGAF